MVLPFDGAFHHGVADSWGCGNPRLQPSPSSVFNSQIFVLESLEIVSWNVCKLAVSGVERFVKFV